VGSGSSKSHESFAVAPAGAAELLIPTPTVGPADPPAATTLTPPAAAEQLTATTGTTPPEAADSAAETATASGIEPGPAPGSVEPAGAVAGEPSADDASTTPGPSPAGDAATSADPATSNGHDPDGVLTPIPEQLEAGTAVGTPVLVGGGDLVDDTARLIRYHGTKSAGDREVLLCHVDPDAEGKLLASLATTAPTMTVQIEKEIHGRLPADTEAKFAEHLNDIGKSVNIHLKADKPIPANTVLGVTTLTEQLNAIANDPSAAAGDKQMAEHYLAYLTQAQARIDTAIGQRPPYASPGGKMGHAEPYVTTGTVTVTETVPDPSQVPLGQLGTTTRGATRIKASLDESSGEASWNGTARRKAAGSEYVVDLGDGYQAVYRPHLAIENSAVVHSQRGSLEILAPPGEGHAGGLVDKLGALNLGNRPLSPAEGEWTYLRRQVLAQNLGGHTEVASALAEAPGLDTAMRHVLMSQRAHEAIGLDEAALHQFAARISSDASHAALPAKVRLLRTAVAHAAGHADGAALASAPGYRPTPQVSGGWLTWSRFDVVDSSAVAAALSGKNIHHRVASADSLVSMFRTGVLASTERRAEMGIPRGIGSSEGSDMDTGGAQSVFCRMGNPIHGSASLIWNNPTTLLRRADWYAYNGDHYGAINPAASQYSSHALTRDPFSVAKFNGGANEVMFRNGIDLLGPEGPDRVRCVSSTHRQQILNILTDKGITHLKGVPITEVITV
jgi:hypothetical protein